jgi:hypothetical protein
MKHKYKVGDLIERTSGLWRGYSRADNWMSIIIGMTVLERPISCNDHHYVRYILKTGEIDICSTVFIDEYYSKPETPDEI